jgi:hypothetical protein
VLQRRARERWSLLAQYALFDLVRGSRLVWSGLLELAGLAPAGELGGEALAAGAEAVGDTPRFAAAMDGVLASPERREELHRLILRRLAHGHEALGRWADVMVNSGTYAEVVDRHVELYSRLYWWGSVLDESEPLEEQHGPRLGLVSPIRMASSNEPRSSSSASWAIATIPLDWWTARLPDPPRRAETP